MEQLEVQLFEAKNRERFGAFKKVKDLCKDFGFRDEILQGALAEERSKRDK